MMLRRMNYKYKIDDGFRRVLWHSSLMLLVVFVALSCSNRDEVEPDDQTKVGYLAINTRAHGSTPSLNEDMDDNEDQVQTLRLMAFEKSTGRAVYNKKHNIDDFTGYSTNVAMRTGEYDFYFVANETVEMETALNRITFREALYYDNVLSSIPYQGINNDSWAPFLMTAETTGTVTSANTENSPLQLDVELIRCLAKVDLNMSYKENMSDEERDMTKGLKLTSIQFTNLPKTYSLFPPKSSYKGNLEPVSDYNIDAAQYEDESEPVLHKAIYIPEYLRSSTADATNRSVIKVAYRKHGIDRKIEIPITHGEWDKAADTYKPSNFGELSLESIVRNTTYSLSALLQGWLEESITYDWEVLPWTLVQSEKSFAGIKVEAEVDPQPGMEIAGSDKNILFWHSGTPGGLKMIFDIKSPAGAVWRFTITNRNDFLLTGRMVNTNNPAISGIAGSGKVELTITPLKPWSGDIRSTELYLTINGIEVQIVDKFKQANIPSGPTHRYLIEQIN